MKQTLFIYSNFDFSIKNAGVTRMFYYAQAIANRDKAVYLVTCSSSKMYKHSFKEIYPNIFILDNNKLTKTYSGTFKFVKNLYNLSEEIGTVNSFLFYPSPLVYLEVIALYYLKFKKKCSLYYELNEVRKYSSTFHGKLSFKRPNYSIKKITFKTVFSILEYVLRYYNGLICISTAIQEYGQRHNKSTIRIPILTNPNLNSEFSKNKYSVKTTFNIGFSGSIQPDKENLRNFFKVLGDLKKSNFDFIFNMCGNIKQEHHDLLIDQMGSELRIKDNIVYYGNLNSKELSTFLSQQQLLVIPRGYTLQNNYGFSTKLSDYLDHSKPVLVTDVSDNKYYIKDNVNGFIVPTDDNKEMYNKLVYIITNYESIYNTIQDNASKTSKKEFYYKNFSNKLSSFLFNTP